MSLEQPRTAQPLLALPRHDVRITKQSEGFQDMARFKSTLPGLIAFLVITLTSDPTLQANPIHATYSTSGTIGTAGLSGTPVFSFQGVSDRTLTTGQPFDLGQFVTTGPPSASGTTYVNTPFHITFTVQTLNGVATSPNGSPVVLDGWLNGTLSPNTTPFAHIYINTLAFSPEDGPPFPTNIAPFTTGSYVSYLSVLSQDLYKPIHAELNLVESVPEPGTILIFGMVGAALTRYRRRLTRPPG
jgi:hypothetical protein